MSAAGERLRLAELLRAHRGRLIAEAGGLAELTRVLDRLVARLEAPSGGPAALELPEQPSNLEALITGHRALRRSLHRVLAGELARVDPAELDVLHDELDEGLIRAASAQAEAERQRAVDALLSASPVGVTFYDRALRLVRANAMIAALAGVPMETLAGRAVGEALPAMAPTLEPALRRVLETGEPVVDLEVTVPMPAAGGAPRALKVNFYPVRTGDGQLQGVGAVLADVTESKRVEEELRRAAEFRERFLGIVSHDLRNPINAIKMSATLLQRADDLPDRLGKPVARIHASADRISRMISELLDFTRGRLGGGIPIAPQPGDLLALVRQVLEEMELTHPGRMLALRAHGHFEGEWDPDRLAQVVSNLAGNALRYGPADTPVTVTLSEQGAEVELAVHNAGAPISPNILPHVFDPFRRGTAQAERSPEGLGLGLFIVQEIVHAHGGTIAVRSTKEAGTTFTVRLPRRR